MTASRRDDEHELVEQATVRARVAPVRDALEGAAGLGAMDTVEAPPPGRLRPGEAFRGLLVHSLLAEGGMGAAHLVSHPVLRSPLVVKTFRETAGRDPFAEAHLAARVRSPHVVEVLDAGREGDVVYVVQRYVDGIDLEELLVRRAAAGLRPPVGVTSRMVLDVARGLGAIHQCGIVHRDVKPANLFLAGDGVCAIGDFGVAIDSDGAAREHGISGTPLFMAPEQWDGRPVDRRTDLYALGCALHLLLTGAPPFAGEALLQLAEAHARAPYEAPRTDDPEAAYLFAVVTRLLRKEPHERYPHAEALVRALGAVREQPLSVAHEPQSARMGPLTVSLVLGDLTEQAADVLVNAANRELRMELGVAAALKRAGGERIETEALEQAPVTMGDVVWTGAGALQASWVAHAVAALAGAVCIQRCLLRLLLEAEAREARSIALPALGTGVGAVPMSVCAHLTLEAIRTFAGLGPRHVRDVRIVLLDGASLAAWAAVLEAL